VSDVRPKSLSFLDLYSDGKVTAEHIDDFIDAWHESDDSEQRPLSEFLGMTEDEYSVWLASHRVLPLLVAARRDGRSVAAVVQQHLADLQHAAAPADETAIYVLSHWLEKRMGG
jgi:hypothetical protein